MPNRGADGRPASRSRTCTESPIARPIGWAAGHLYDSRCQRRAWRLAQPLLGRSERGPSGACVPRRTRRSDRQQRSSARLPIRRPDWLHARSVCRCGVRPRPTHGARWWCVSSPVPFSPPSRVEQRTGGERRMRPAPAARAARSFRLFASRTIARVHPPYPNSRDWIEHAQSRLGHPPGLCPR